MSLASDPAWRAVVAARGDVHGKVFVMTMATMRAIRKERGELFNPHDHYFLYGIPVTYDEFMPHNTAILEKR